MLAATAVTGATLLVTPLTISGALADGGAGGDGGNGASAGGSGFTGNAGGNGVSRGGGGGGGAGGGAGGRGDGPRNYPGGAGGTAGSPDGGNAPYGADGAGGGGGGYNGNGPGSASIHNGGSLTGGKGGNGGNSDLGGGGGGAGGYGAVVLGGGASSNVGTIAGGAGGNGGTSGFEQGGGGGDGGVGVWFDAPGAVFTNFGTVAGGQGGALGVGGGMDGAAGRGGVGIAGADLMVVMNGGTVSGGISGDAATRADAIAFGAGANTLRLNGGTLEGDISIAAGGNIAFDQTGAYALTNAITGAGSISHTGTGTLTLSGTNTFSGGATISNGTVVLNHIDGLNLFDSIGSGAVTLNGGELRAAITGSLANDLNFADNTTSRLSAATGTVLTLGGDPNTTGNQNTGFYLGAGATAIFGATDALGTIRVNASALVPSIDATSAIVVAGGTLQDLQGSLWLLTAQTGSVTVEAGATIDFNDAPVQAINNLSGAGNVMTGPTAGGNLILFGSAGRTNLFSGVISGAKGVQLAGFDTMIFAGDNTYTGGTVICDCATLQLGNGGTTGSILGDVTNDGTLIFNRSNEYTFNGVISGDGIVRQAGTGTTILTAANTYTGGTEITGGTLALNNVVGGQLVGLGTGAVSISGGTLRTLATGNIGNEIYFTPNATSRLSAAAGTVLTVDGRVYLNANSTAVFGSPTDTGVIRLVAPWLVNSSAKLVVAGGTLEDVGNLSYFLRLVASVTVDAGATLDFRNSVNPGISNLNGAGNILLGAAANIVLSSHAGQTNLFSGVISGPQSVEIFNPGTMIFAGANTYTGHTTIAANATLQLGNGGTTGSILGNVANGGRLLFNRSDAYTFDGVISGSGTVSQNGPGTTILTAINTYNGATAVNGGTLRVNGALTNTITTVNNGGTLGGTGSVSTTVIANGGTLAPGNSIGTFTISRHLTFLDGATYAVEVSPTAADRTNVSGFATLNGTVNLTVAPGVYAANQQFIILTSVGGFTNTRFSGIAGTGFAAGTPTLAYSAQEVSLVFPERSVVLLPTFTGNAGAVAQGINNAMLGGANPSAAFQTLFGLGNAQLGNALVQLTGQNANGVWLGSAQMTNAFLSLMLNPLGNAPAAGSSVLGFARAFGAGERMSAEAREAYAAVTPADRRTPAYSLGQRWGAWGQAYGGYNATRGDSTAGIGDVTARTWGLAAGADYRATDNTTLGFAVAGGTMNWGLSDALGGGRSETFQFGAFASHMVGNAYVAAAASYSWHDVRTDRTVTAVGFEKMTASFHAFSIGGRIETGYRFVTPWLGVTPYAAAQVQQFRAPSYGERADTGTGAFALNYDARRSTATRLELGAWFDRSIAIDGGHWLTLRGRAAYAHDRTGDNATGAVFQALPGSNFVVNGTTPPSSLALLSAAAELRLASQWSVGAKFDGEFGRGARTYTGTASLRYAW